MDRSGASPTRTNLRGGQRIEVPRTVGVALEAIFGERVRLVQVFECCWILRLHGRAVATTRRRRIYLRHGAAEFFVNPWLMLHEYCHVLNQWEPGRLTRTGYLLESTRRGYWNNHFEVEARAFADTHAMQLQALLTASGSDGKAV
jgi:hypothetical protein